MGSRGRKRRGKKEKKQKRNFKSRRKRDGEGMRRGERCLWRIAVTLTAASGITWDLKPKWGDPTGLDEKNRDTL